MPAQMVESIYLNSSSDGGVIGTGAGIGAPKINFGNTSQRLMNDTLNISSGISSTEKQSSYGHQHDSISTKRMKSNYQQNFDRPDDQVNLRMNSKTMTMQSTNYLEVDK